MTERHITNINICIADHRVEEVPPKVRKGMKCLAKSLNSLRIKTYRHVIGLQRVTPDEFRVIVCNPERYWEGDDHKHVCLAKSVSDIFAIVSHRRYLTWQNFDLLEEIIEAYGDSNLKGELKGFCEEIEVFENETSLEDVKNIIFTPLGPNGYLMKVPLDGKPTLATARSIKNGLKKKNGYPVHHVGQNSPLAIFFIVPRLFIPPISVAKLKATPESIEDRVIYTLSEQEVLQLLNVSNPKKVYASLCIVHCITFLSSGLHNITECVYRRLLDGFSTLTFSILHNIVIVYNTGPPGVYIHIQAKIPRL